ncbi:MAG: exodeoxyribonuclease III [Bdellovibrionales bacterium]|nr:exodeoxyribonuclease III [Bdellovibrionales bacterium]
MSRNKKVKLICWNVNGLRAIYKKNFKQFLSRQKADVICIQETKSWMDQLEESQINPAKYNGYFSEAEKKGYSGTATFVHQDHNVLAYEKQLNLPHFDKEGRFLVTRHKNFDLYNCYFPSGSSGDLRQAFKYDFLDAFYNHLKNLPKKKRERLIICGDYNICHKEIDIHHPKEAERLELSGFLPAEREWMDEFAELGFIDAYRYINGEKKDCYTWWSYRGGARQKNLGWRIDYFFVGKALKKNIKQAKILSQTTGSDHCPISLELEF